MASEKSDLPQITKDSDTETDYESNPLVERNSGSKVDYKFVLFSIGIVGLGLFFYNQSKKPEKMIKEIVVGKEKPKKPEKTEKEIDPFEFNEEQRNGGWSDWEKTSTACLDNCGRALQNRTRTCTKPSPNEYGTPCYGISYEERICNDFYCHKTGHICKNQTLGLTCANGYLQINIARWQTSDNCDGYVFSKFFDVIQPMKQLCENRKTCTFTANDDIFQVSCSKHMETWSQFAYTYSCITAKWNEWTKWSECSKSCGTGKQVRTRNCSDQFNTTDGHFVDCDGPSTETRLCNTVNCQSEDIGKHIQYNLTQYERTAVVHEDIIGWYDDGNNIIGHYDCFPANANCPVFALLNNQNPINNGDEIDTDGLSTISNKIFALNFSTTGNMPIEFQLADELIDIPNHSAVDTYVIRSVHVKTSLPHIKGKQNATLNYTFTVQDSCFNFAKVSITIIVYNAPPVVTDLPKELIIDPQKLQEISRFHLFNVKDPTDDNVSCILSKISPSTDELVLEIDGNEAYLLVSNYTKSNSTLGYKLFVVCQDETNEIVVELTVYFRSKKDSYTNTETFPSITLIIIFVCGSLGGLLFIILVIVISYCIWKFLRKLNMETKESQKRIRHRQYMSTIDVDFGVITYDDLEQNRDLHAPHDYVELSDQDAPIYENA
ncbi:unnamed protein product [Mytilus coruscus]|uniref:Uncharacterized protein n=1 Tax=Mytilus coruscus TaxID=42192 RepID=A0A6J8DAF9_MYTCO|nr:unnamed protein product [Mytilus coruscus]